MFKAAGVCADACEASGGTRYRLSVNEAFERSWEAIVQAHGVDWLGFRRLRAAYAALHRMRPQLRARALRCQPPATGREVVRPHRSITACMYGFTGQKVGSWEPFRPCTHGRIRTTPALTGPNHAGLR